MLDQNTTTVLTAVITVGGTLGGVVLGVILSNRYSLKQEKGKRNTPIIEEAYTLIDKIDNRLSDCLYTGEFVLGDIAEKRDRITTLINLYLRDVRKDYDEYNSVLWQLMDLLRGYGGNQVDDSRSTAIEESQTYKEYEQISRKLKQSLEKLVD